MSENWTRLDEILALSKGLSLQDKQTLAYLLRAEIRTEAGNASSPNWMTLDEAADDLRKSKSQVSRDAKEEKLLTNGRRGRHLRISRLSVAHAHAQQALRFFKKAIQWRRREWPDEPIAETELEDAILELLEIGVNIIRIGVDAGGATKEMKKRIAEIFTCMEEYVERCREKGWCD
jgi:hypothetical protein